MSIILSIQSHVAYGYVGNKAAVFPLQRLGNEVVTINTVQFSNHTGYGEWTGDIMSIEHIDSIFHGLQKRNIFNNLNAVLTGYIGDNMLGEVLLKWIDIIKKNNPNIIYCCDPVIGDVGRGIFVRDGVPQFFKDSAVYYASILTPNQFELEYLTNIKIYCLNDVFKACQVLHDSGVGCILVTSLECKDIVDTNEIAMIASTNSQKILIKTPKLSMPISPNGSGDMTAALFLAKYLETRDYKLALEYVGSAIYGVFKITLDNHQRELAVIPAQNEFINPSDNFQAIVL